jgi:RIO kinase 1
MSMRRKETEQEYDFDREIANLGIRIKDVNTLKVRGEVFDEITLLALYKLVHKKWISAIGGSISTGKEANVFLAEKDSTDIAIKIYRMRTANFNAMSEYIIGDRRFAGIKKTKKDLIFAWSRKEFSNLKRAHTAGLSVPEPFVWDRNILVMEFIGSNGISYPHLKNANAENPDKIYREIMQFIEDLYKKAGLIHADLSEFNILYHEKPYIIDMGQSVTIDHPRAFKFLKRDIANINHFFSSQCDVEDEKVIFSRVTGMVFPDTETNETKPQAKEG